MKAAMVRFLLPVGALIVLAGCASSPYRTGYYYPSEHGQGDYYSAPAERRYDDRYYGPYYDPYYSHGFYSYPYYRGGFGFYGRYPHSPYRHSRLGFSLNYGGYDGYGPSYGFGYRYSSPQHHDYYRQPYRSHRLDRGDDDRHRDSDRRHDRNDRDHRENRNNGDRPDHRGQRPIRVQARDTDPDRYLRRSTPDKYDPGTQRPMRFVGNDAGGRRRAEQDLQRRSIGRQPTGDAGNRRQTVTEAPIRIRQTDAQPRVVQQPRFVNDGASGGKRKSNERPSPGPSPVMSGRSRAAVVAPATGGRSAAIDRAQRSSPTVPSPRAAPPVRSVQAQPAVSRPAAVSAPKASAPKISARGKVGRFEQDSADRSSENRSR
jgi:hypothetical protein